MAERTPLERRDRTMGLSIVAVSFIASLCISWWARTTVAPPVGAPEPPTTEGIVGYPKSVDPVRSLEAAQNLTERHELRGISAWGVLNGAVDVSSPGNRVRYVFTSPRGQGPQPPRPPGTLPRRDYCGRQNVHIKDTGMVADPDQPASSCAQERTDPLPTPRCGLKEVWSTAMAKGFRPDAGANIEYFRAGAGPAWRIEQPLTHRTMVLYGDCERELSGADAAGAIP